MHEGCRAIAATVAQRDAMSEASEPLRDAARVNASGGTLRGIRAAPAVIRDVSGTVRQRERGGVRSSRLRQIEIRLGSAPRIVAGFERPFCSVVWGGMGWLNTVGGYHALFSSEAPRDISHSASVSNQIVSIPQIVHSRKVCIGRSVADATSSSTEAVAVRPQTIHSNSTFIAVLAWSAISV